jgi:transposase
MRRRRYTREFKISAVQLVQEQGYTVPDAAKSLGVDRTSVRTWLTKFGAEAQGNGSIATGDAAVRRENRRLREENRRLRLEAEILKKAAAFFAKDGF